MSKFNSDRAMIDLLANQLVGYCALFILAFLLISPISRNGEVDPPVRMIVEITWPEESLRDIDLWFRGPDGRWVYYNKRSNGYATLERDDLGGSSDTYIVNGEEVTVKRNYEVINVVDLPTGEYLVNVHYFSGSGEAITVRVRITTLSPYKTVFETELGPITPTQEVTAVSFIVDQNGQVSDVRTDVQVSGRRQSNH